MALGTRGLAKILALIGSAFLAAYSFGQINGGGGFKVDPFPSMEDARRSGPGHYWQGGGGGVNPYSHGKVTPVGLIGWNTLGGTPMGLALSHCSMATQSSSVGTKWRHSYGTELLRWAEGGLQRAAVIWGDHRIQMFRRTSGTWICDDGYRDVLAQQGQNYELTTHGQTRIMFEPTITSQPNYAKRHRMFAIIDRTQTVVLNYDGLNRLIRVDDPAGRSLRFTYSGPRLIAIGFFVGSVAQRTWQLIQDANFNLVRLQLPPVTTDTGPQTYFWTFDYDGRSNVIEVGDPRGNDWKYEYVGDRLVSELWPGNTSAQKVLYGLSGVMRNMTDPSGHPMSYEYDSLGRLIRARDGGNNDTIFEHGDPDHPFVTSRIVSPSGTPYRYDYDANGNLVRHTDPSGNAWDMTYDANNNLIQALEPLVVDGFGNTETFRHRTNYSYDSLNRLTQVSRQASTSSFFDVFFEIDPFSNVTRVTNELGRQWNYTYDALGNLTSATTPMNRVVRWFYDTSALTAGFTTPNAVMDNLGVRVERVNDEWGRLQGLDAPGLNDRRYEYDAMGRLVQVMDPAGLTDYLYNSKGQKVREQRGPWFANLAYHPNGQLQSMLEDSGTGPRQVVYSYNSRSLLSSMNDAGSNTAFSYNSDGRLVMRLLGNGAMSMWGYNAGRVASSMQHDGIGGTLINLAYSYQSNGMLAQLNENGLLQRYQYDALNRLIRQDRNAGPAFDHLWAYDALGNRTQQNKTGLITNYSYDPDDNLVQAIPQGGQPEQYIYDGNGQLVRRVRNNSGEIFQFAYDAYRHLVDIDRWDGAAFVPYRNYAYDGLDRRVQREVSNGVQTIGTNNYYGGLTRVETNNQGQPSTEVLTWAGGFIRTQDLNGREMWGGTDALGNQRTSTDANGAWTTLSTVYNAFGETMQTSGPATVWGYGTDAGMRDEGDAGYIAKIDWSGPGDEGPEESIVFVYGNLGAIPDRGEQSADVFYDAKIGLCLPPGTNSFGGRYGQSRVGGGLTGPGIPPQIDSFFDVFTTVDLPAVRSGYNDWRTNYGVGPSAGDVDGRDFLIWQRNPSAGSGGYADWQANYGSADVRVDRCTFGFLPAVQRGCIDWGYRPGGNNNQIFSFGGGGATPIAGDWNSL